MAPRSTRTPPLLLIAEARPTLAAGLKYFLAGIPDTHAVAIMTGFDDVVDHAEQHEIGLIIVGKGVNWATPLSEFRRLRRKNPSWRLALLADVADRDSIVAGLSEGACGIIPTSVDEHELRSAITRILAGSIYIPNMTASAERPHPVWRSGASGARSRPLLTPRQYEVLGVLAQGNSNKQIAHILGISESTVSMHLNATFLALGVHDRTSAAMAYRAMAHTDHAAHYDWSEERNSASLGRRMLTQSS